MEEDNSQKKKRRAIRNQMEERMAVLERNAEDTNRNMAEFKQELKHDVSNLTQMVRLWFEKQNSK